MYHIGFCGDEKYIQYIAVTMYSIVKNTNVSFSYKDKLPYAIVENQNEAKEKYYFHIITDNLSESTVNKISLLEKELNAIYPCSIEIHYAKDEMYAGCPPWRGNYAAYYRILYPQILPKEIKYFLYMDGDILVDADIRDLFCVNLDGYALGAVAQYNVITKKLQKHILAPKHKGEKTYSFFTHKYNLSSGLMLIDMHKWREEHIEEKFFWFLNTYAVKYPDQDALNYVFKDNFKVLDFKYNMYLIGVDKNYMQDVHTQLREYGIMLNEYEKPDIIHYILKPWNSAGLCFSNHTVIYNEYIPLWWEYAEKTPVFSDELMKIRQSEAYKQQIQRDEKRKLRYEKYRYFYWLRKKVSVWKRRFVYWLNSLREKKNLFIRTGVLLEIVLAIYIYIRYACSPIEENRNVSYWFLRG